MEEDLRLKNSHWCCGVKFMKWGIGFFVLGLFLSFGIFIYYLMGSRWNVAPQFLNNITLWFGSPLSLSTSYVLLGGLGMAAIGGVHLWLSSMCQESKTTTYDTHYTHHKHGILGLCIFGLFALILTGYIGYFIIDAIWPGFYYAPYYAGKNLWLVLQGLSLFCYFIGIISAYNCACKCCKQCKINHS